MIFKNTLRRMCGEATINETKGYLFHEYSDFRFAYRTPFGVAVDIISPGDRLRMWRWFGRLIGYRLSGEPIQSDYSHIEHNVPQVPVLDRVPTEDDFEKFDRRVVLYGNKLAVIQDFELVYRDIEYTVDPETKTPESFGDCIKMLKVLGDNGSAVVRELKIPPARWDFYGQADILLRRNGI